MEQRDFEKWLNGFKTTIASWNYYVDFEKVDRNIRNIKRELCLMNVLLGSKNIRKEFISLARDYPKIISVIPILLAKREHDIRIFDMGEDLNFNFSKPNYTVLEYADFMERTGLFKLLSTHLVKDLVDYVRGVEVGMDTNGRKNRTGHCMEYLVEKYIKEAGFVKGENYFSEMLSEEIERKFNIDLSPLTTNKTAKKRFDFVIVRPGCVYGIEVNFYGSGGSKLNETAGNYLRLARAAKAVKGFEFVWFTDGAGWSSAKNYLKQVFDVSEYLFSIQELEKGVISKRLK